MSGPIYSLQAATLTDIPFMAKISGVTFDLDRNTQVKAMGKDGYDLEVMCMSDAARYIASPK